MAGLVDGIPLKVDELPYWVRGKPVAKSRQGGAFSWESRLMKKELAGR
jgi:hypothetical protein